MVGAPCEISNFSVSQRVFKFIEQYTLQLAQTFIWEQEVLGENEELFNDLQSSESIYCCRNLHPSRPAENYNSRKQFEDSLTWYKHHWDQPRVRQGLEGKQDWDWPSLLQVCPAFQTGSALLLLIFQRGIPSSP